MSRLDAVNAGALLLAVIVSLSVGGATPRKAPRSAASAGADSSLPEVVRTEGGGRALRDATGALVPLKRYERFVSLSLIADHLLWELLEPERLVGVTRRSKESPYFGHRHAGRAGIGSLEELERILALEPDLVVVNRFGDPRFVTRLRERGITVFDLGDIHGLQTLTTHARMLGALAGRPEAGARIAKRLRRRMRAIAADVPPDRRLRAVYVSVYGKQLYGGARGTSYHDILTHAGLVDAAAERYEGWPALGAEQLLALDPNVIVTQQGMAAPLCEHPGMARLRACGDEGQVVELDGHLADDPGPPMLDMAEALHDAVYGHGEANE